MIGRRDVKSFVGAPVWVDSEVGEGFIEGAERRI